MMDRLLYSDEFLNPKRLVGDSAADKFIADIFACPDKRQQLQHLLRHASGSSGLHQLKNTYPGYNLISDAGNLPPWADLRLMKAGSVFFARHSEMIMSLLGLLSLPYCYTAANGAMVLYLSGLIRKQTTQRLYDTATFVWEVMGPDAFGSAGNACTEILKVRIMHAAVRYYTLQSGKWNNAWGIPVNQEDMAGTNLSFSLIVIRGLRMLGYNVSQPDQAAFMHIWAVVGYLTGLDGDMIPENAKMAQHLDQAIKQRQFTASMQGKELTGSLIAHILAVNKSKATDHDILGLMRYLLGDDVAGMLSITAPQLPAYKLNLLRMTNLLKSFRPVGDVNQKYRLAFEAFKQQNPELNKRT